MTEAEFFALLETLHAYGFSMIEYLRTQFPGQMTVLAALILTLSALSCAAGHYLGYLRDTRYRGALRCTAKREQSWGHRELAGFFGMTTVMALHERNEPNVIQVVLEDGRVALLSVSPARFRTIEVGDVITGRLARLVLRRALFVGRPKPGSTLG